MKCGWLVNCDSIRHRLWFLEFDMGMWGCEGMVMAVGARESGVVRDFSSDFHSIMFLVCHRSSAHCYGNILKSETSAKDVLIETRCREG